MQVDWTKPSVTLTGTFAEVFAILDQAHDIGLLFDYSLEGWTHDPMSPSGHLTSRAFVRLIPDNDIEEAKLRLMLG